MPVVGRERQSVVADNSSVKTITCTAGDTLYYGSSNVSSGVNDGSLSVGQSVEVDHTTWLVSASTSRYEERIVVTAGTGVLTVNGEEPDGDGNVEVVALPTGGLAGQTLRKSSPTDGDAAWAKPPGAGLAIAPGTQGWGYNVHGGEATTQLTGILAGNFRHRVKVPDDATVLTAQFVFPNWWVQDASNHRSEKANDNDIFVAAAVETVAGVVTPVCGKTRIAAGDSLVTLPVDINLAASDGYFFLRIYLELGTTSEKAPWGRYSTSGDGEHVVFYTSSPVNQTNSTGLFATGGTSYAGQGNLYGPTAMLVRVKNERPNVAVLGDSIDEGYYDPTANEARIGFIERAFAAAKIGYLRLPSPGERCDGTTRRPRKMGMVTGADYIFEGFGINDVRNGRTVANLKDDKVALWRKLAARASRGVITRTLTPETTSSDSWATLGNQTVTAASGLRATVNDWLRDGAPINPTTFAVVAVGGSGVRIGETGHPVIDLWDVAATIESGGKWVVGTTSDGLHPNASGHTAMAAAVDTSVID